ncbi:DNA alkylation repair protein [Fulvivirgaceae bacterium BMA12]|uniref:DNA alkylation repair protein n=1 Tax=Agaribacillus aureus TaxID=3051825 RepID=A0ABT8LA70_9BACT|nr:DNA alkylation repair protein [Fulvivirgaceae bacterium BMA12]
MAEALKDQMFQRPFFEALGKSIGKVYPSFSTKDFFSYLYNEDWEDKSLKERMYHASQSLHETLPDNYDEALDILSKVYQKFDGFDAMIFPDFVEQFGQDHYQLSIEALERFTQFSSAEFAIRPFILKHPEKTMDKMLSWSRHDNHHVRRLSSEGCRPRLPWAMALPLFKKDPGMIFPILDNLKSDPSLYVRKSVANNLNDITKDNPDLVIARLEKWQTDASKETQWITRHALRGMLKAGHPNALKLLGYGSAKVSVDNFKLKPRKIAMGDSLSFSFELRNDGKRPQNLMVDFIVHFVKSNGSTAPKVFKLNTLKLAPGETQLISKSHPFKVITTRKYYSGKHKLAVQVNGKVLGEQSFDLKV